MSTIAFCFLIMLAGPSSPEWVFVDSVHVGDHIRVVMGDSTETVRLIGVDTPGFIHGKNAAEIAQTYSTLTRNLTEGARVRLETDPRVPDRDARGDLLRYVYLEDGMLVNAEIIREGYGRVDPTYPFTRADQFLELHARATDRRLELHKSWNPEPPLELTLPKLIASSRAQPTYPETERKRGKPKYPAPFPEKTEILSSFLLAAARSLLPSRLKSATTTAVVPCADERLRAGLKSIT